MLPQTWWHDAATGRECVYPEVNRNLNIGEQGVNMNSQVFRQYLSKMSFNQETASLAQEWSVYLLLNFASLRLHLLLDC